MKEEESGSQERNSGTPLRETEGVIKETGIHLLEYKINWFKK